MAVERAFTGYAVDIDSVLFDQITAQAVSAELNEILLSGDGSVYNQYAAIGQVNSLFNLTTTAIAVALAKAGLEGFKIEAGSVATAFFQQYKKGGTREGVSKHVKMVINEGMIIPRQITVANNGVATISYDIVCTFDGTNEPIVITKDQSLTGVPAVTEAFTVGPVNINGVAITGVQSITIDFGINLITLGGEGEGYPTFVAIDKTAPTITIETTDADQLDDIDLAGVAQGGTDSVIYLRKIDEGSNRVLDATAEHISFTIDEGRINVSGANAPGGMATTTIRIVPTWDGTNAVLVINTAVAIV